MLRASIEYTGEAAELRGIADGVRAGDAGIAHGERLVAFADAAVGGDAARCAEARGALRAAAGSEAVVDAAGVIGNFERMVRIADGTGIPLDGITAAVSGEIRDDLGLDAFRSRRTTRAAAWSGVVGPPLRRVVLGVLRLAGRRGA
jgi:hypothetical protein